MTLVDALGAALTLLTLTLLGLGGWLAALRLLGAAARRDRLALAIASLLAASAEAVAIALVLGALGQLRLAWALAVQTLLVVLLLRGKAAGGIAPEAELVATLGVVGQRVWQRLRQHPALALATLTAISSEALRGLLRPPLSWDSLMYHLLLTATWLQTGGLQPVLGVYPISDFGFMPGNGSLWFWWWMAPSHGELYVNLALLPHWVLLGLAVGGIARELGGRRVWPLAAVVVLVLPTVVRFAATEYVDIFLAAVFLAGVFFTLRWIAAPSAALAALAGMGCGLAAGTKILGVPYVALWAVATVAAAGWGGGSWRRRAPQLALALLLTMALGGFFYVRNAALGAGPLALVCDAAPNQPRTTPGQLLPRADSLVDRALHNGWQEALPTLDAFLGATLPNWLELGAGPPALLVLLAIAAVFWRALRRRRRLELLVASQILAELAFWLAVPGAGNRSIYANIRYLIPALGLAVAGGAALLDGLGVEEAGLSAVAFLAACQGLLTLHAEMPREVRVFLAVADVVLVALAVSAPLRGVLRRQLRPVVVTAVTLAILLAPLLGSFRRADRPRALAREFTAHHTSIHVFVPGWEWLDRHGENGTVDVVASPATYFMYPAMGPDLERRAIYVNINAANHAVAASYPRCDLRSEPSPEAWIANLDAAGVRWLLLNRYQEFDFSIENRWAAQRPDRFALRFLDTVTVIYELHPAGAPVAALEPALRQAAAGVGSGEASGTRR